MSIDACALMVAEADPDRFGAAMCVKSLAQRADLMVLYALNIEVSRAPWVTQEQMIAEMRLQWWKDAIDEIYGGKTVRKHEVVIPLAELVHRDPERFPRALFDDLIEARRFDIYREPYQNRSGFNLYISNTSGNVMELAGRAVGASDLTPFQEVGWASGLANLMGALPELYAHGRDPIPLGPIDQNAVIEGRFSEENVRNIRELAQEGLARLSAVEIGKLPKTSRAPLFAAWNAKRVLRAVERAPETALRRDTSASQFRRAASLFWLNLRHGLAFG